MSFANQLALRELKAALGALDAPYSDLPDVKNKDGESITDVKEKRLALVRQHVETAGSIINLVVQVVAQAEMAVQVAIASKYKDVLKDALVEQGAPAEVLEALDHLPQLGGTDDCPCDNCKRRRANQNGEEKKEEEEERVFGFASAVRRK